MPNNLNNWEFDDVESFLTKNHHFQLVHSVGSHHYYLGYVDGEQKLVEIQKHQLFASTKLEKRNKSAKKSNSKTKTEIAPTVGFDEELKKHARRT